VTAHPAAAGHDLPGHHYVLGIDVGTTYTAAAISRGGVAEMLALGSSGTTIPSVVLLRDDGEVLAGEAAERRAVTEPTRIAREFKRRIGDPTPIIVGGTPYGAESLVAHLIRTVLETAQGQEGAAPARVVLTHPASWSEFKIDLLRQAARLAGVNDADVVTEPEAAALHYVSQERIEPGQVIAVYDLGGGTFDAAVLRRTADGFEVLGVPEGMERFGGIDIDRAMLAHVDDALGGVLSTQAADGATASSIARLRDDVRIAKESLSADSDAAIPVLLPGLNTEVRITRGDLETMVRPRLHETIEAMRRCVRSAGLDWDDVHAVLAVGGSSRIPLVRELVRETTGRPVVVDTHPKHAIALGAAKYAALAAANTTPDLPVTAAGVVSTAALPTDAPASEAATASGPNHGRLALIGAAVAAVVAVVGIGVVAAGGGGDSAEPSTTTTAVAATTAPPETVSPETADAATTTEVISTTVAAPPADTVPDSTLAEDTSSTTASTTAPTAAPTTLAPSGADETVEVVDGSGTFAVTFPMQFTTNVEPLTIAGVDFAQVTGAEDLPRYLSGDWSAFGATVFVTSNVNGNAADLAAVFDPGAACATRTGPTPFTTDIGVGLAYEFDNCGGSTWAQSVIAVDVPSQGAVAVIAGQGAGPASSGLTNFFGLLLSSVRPV
jgi:actin-like ATPase involved in cell morphogenesis